MIEHLPHPLLSPSSPSCLSFAACLCVARRAYWRESGGGGKGGSQIIRRRESLVSIKHSILSAFDNLSFFVAGTSRWGTTRPSSGGTGGTRSGTLFFSDWAPHLQFQRDTYHKKITVQKKDTVVFAPLMIIIICSKILYFTQININICLKILLPFGRLWRQKIKKSPLSKCIFFIFQSLSLFDFLTWSKYY